VGKFASDIEAFCRASLDKCDLTTRMIALEVFRRVIMKTPVDTGRARGNWMCTIGVPAEAIAQGDDWLKGQLAGDFDKLGGTTIQAAADEVMAWNPREVAVFLTNNLPYIQALEDGHSGQAPSGMVAVTLAEFDGITAGVMQS
jgi:hypothetical protein